MPHKTKTAAADKAAMPRIPAELLEQLIPGSVTPGQLEDIFQQFKKAFIERALGAGARSPRVTTHSFAAQPPDLRRLALITRASRFMARSPCSAAPSIQFLFIGSQLRYTLPPHTRSPSCSCASLRSL